MHKEKKTSGIAGLSSAYFSAVMATGIVSLAAALQGFPRIANGLFVLNIFLYVVLWALYLIRLVRYRKEFVDDLFDHIRALPFFTVVAATGVLGSQFAILWGEMRIASILAVLALFLWVILTYTIFTILTVKKDKPSLDKGISGGWLLTVVATQALSVLTALINSPGHPWALELNFFSLSMWLLGGMLYIWLISLIYYRYLFFPFQPSDLAPPYWINMGAMAISTLAGSLLILNAPQAPFLNSLLPFLKGFTVFYWATGTWWIPMLFVLAFWRHVYRRFPLRYDPLYWGAVFPLGMYTVCTMRLSRALELEFLLPLTKLFFILAVVAWLAAFIGMLRSVISSLKK